MNAEKYDYDLMVKNIYALKEKFILLFGKPKMDNTNHFNKNNISINFATESLSLNIVCSNTNEYGSLSFATIFATNFNKNLNKTYNYRLSSILGLWILSFVGGLIWGLVMFFALGQNYGYKTIFLIICMCGGLFFGVIYAFLFSIFDDINNDNIKKGKVKKEQIIKQFSLDNKNNLFEGKIFTYNISSPHAFKQRMDLAILELNDLDVIVYSIIKRKELILKISNKKAYYHLLTRKDFDFNRVNVFYLVSFDDENFKELERKLFEKLIDENKYKALFEKLKKVTVEYNPYQVYDSNDSSYLDNLISIIAKILLIKPRIKHKNLHEIIYNIFGYDRYTTESLTDLYLNA